MPRKTFEDSDPHASWLPNPSALREQRRWQDHPAVTGLFLLLAIVCVIAVLGWGHRVDVDAADADLAEAAVKAEKADRAKKAAQALGDYDGDAYTQAAAMYERGFAEGKALALLSVRAAYAAGQRDAMESVQGTPQGVALAQACLAQGALAGVRGATNVHGVAK